MTDESPQEQAQPTSGGAERRSIGELVAVISEKLGLIVRNEIAFFKSQAAEKVKGAAVGIALLAVGGVLALYALAVLLAAAVLGLSNAFSPWLAALIVGGALLLIVAILVLVGLRSLKKGQLPSGEEIKDHVKEDVSAVTKGFRS